MTLALTLLCRVVRRRVSAGEELEKVLEDYPRMTEEERQYIKELVQKA